MKRFYNPEVTNYRDIPLYLDLMQVQVNSKKVDKIHLKKLGYNLINLACKYSFKKY
jgi:hypothetical protein